MGARTDGRTHRLKVPARSQRWYHWGLEAILSADKALIVGSCICAETASCSSQVVFGVCSDRMPGRGKESHPSLVEDTLETLQVCCTRPQW